MGRLKSRLVSVLLALMLLELIIIPQRSLAESREVIGIETRLEILHTQAAGMQKSMDESFADLAQSSAQKRAKDRSYTPATQQSQQERISLCRLSAASDKHTCPRHCRLHEWSGIANRTTQAKSMSRQDIRYGQSVTSKQSSLFIHSTSELSSFWLITCL